MPELMVSCSIGDSDDELGRMLAVLRFWFTKDLVWSFSALSLDRGANASSAEIRQRQAMQAIQFNARGVLQSTLNPLRFPTVN